MEANRKSIYSKIAILSLAILLLGGFWLSSNEISNPISIVSAPIVPKEGEPILVTFKLNNPRDQELLTSYQFYADGELLATGDSIIPSGSCLTNQYAYTSYLQAGEQRNFVVRTQSELGNYEDVVSLPSYPPQIWSSFVSFAAISTTMMSQMTSMAYFDSVFGINVAFNMGLVVTIVLLMLLILMDLTQPRFQRNTVTVMGRLYLRYSTVAWILFIIFIGIVYTQVVTILTT
ncbi:hypothetical protein ACFLV3_04910 [Chloroflexota bacterium]